MEVEVSRDGAERCTAIGGGPDCGASPRRHSMEVVRRALLAAVLLLSLPALASAAGADERLVWRSSKAAGFSVKLPADWRYRNATYPSDHTTEYWTDPGDPKSRLKVEVSRCVGCVQPTSCVLEGTGCRPAPEQVVPVTTTQKTKLDRWRVRFVARTPGNPYPDRGLVAVRHEGEEIEGFALVQLWLPAGQTRLAGRILASFRIG